MDKHSSVIMTVLSATMWNERATVLINQEGFSRISKLRLTSVTLDGGYSAALHFPAPVVNECSIDVRVSFIVTRVIIKGSFQTKKRGNSGKGDEPSGVGAFLNLGILKNGLTPPLKSTWDFFEAE